MDKNLIIRNTILLYFRMIIVLIVTLFASRIILKALGIEDFGLLNVVYGVVALISYIQNTLSTSSSRFITYELGTKNGGRCKEVFNNVFIVHILISLVFLILIETIGLWVVNYILIIPNNRLLACNIVFQTAVVVTVFTFLRIPFNSLIIAHEKMGVFAGLSIANALIGLLIAYFTLYHLGDRLIIFSLLSLIPAICSTLVSFLYCKIKYPVICEVKKSYDKNNIKGLLSFSTWNLLWSTAVAIRIQGMNILINVFWGAVVNAANAIASQVNRGAILFTENFTNSLKPQITKSYASGDSDSLRKLLFLGGKISFLLMVLVCFPVLFETPYILKIWLGDIPEYSVVFTRMVIIVSLLEIFNETIGTSIQATGKIKNYQIMGSIIVFFNFPLSFLAFYVGLPVWSAYLINILLSVVTMIPRLFFVERLLNISWIDYAKEVLLKSLLLSGAAAIVPMFIVYNMVESVWRLILIVILGTITTIIFSLFICFGRSERDLISQII